MSFEDVLSAKISDKSVAQKQLILAFKERPHVSKSKIDANEDSKYLNVGESASTVYGETSQRYISAQNLTYDLIFSIYDVNSSALFCARAYKTMLPLKPKIASFLKSLHGPHLEARLIGLQNNQDIEILGEIMNMQKKYKIPLFEVDLFGNATRNIALDSKVGMSFDILLGDRLYRPGELLNKTTLEQFERTIKGPG